MSDQNSSLPGASLGLIRPDFQYLVGVSGGRDSMVLLDWLSTNRFQNLLVCHFNHGLRGEDSEGDEAFVKQWSADLGLKCLSVREDSRAFARESRQSLETAAREARYRFFARIAKEMSCHRLLLAHHADDQIETVVMNLFRGTGLKGLGGMEAVSQREMEGVPLEIIRPFLKVTRAELKKYQEGKGLSFREDSTNRELIATRNRVRHELLPLAEEIFGRDVSSAILRLSEIAGMEASATQLRAKQWLDSHQSAVGDLPLKPLRLLAPVELNHVLHLWLKTREIPNCGFREVQMIVQMVLSDQKPAKVNLPGGHFARRRSGVVFVTGGDDS